ncbi:hypothetical protein [Loigolactobacillus binensis]|uniref:Uncharacterized protein n=1 Tax=Loigolactobacillus binensis TaxID=2559922 RepID=A0ABW3EAT8_9LACO|nr:hypothetical protein [Loigolactobacillus binensis]
MPLNEDLPILVLISFAGTSNNTASSSSIMISQQNKTVTHLSEHQKQLPHNDKIVRYDPMINL